MLVTLAEAKEHLRILHDDEDAYITALIPVAQAQAEADTDMVFTSTDWIDVFEPCRNLSLAKSPVANVASVLIGETATVDYELYQSEVGTSTICLPSLPTEDVTVTYSTSLQRSNQTAIAKHMMLLLIGQMFSFREMEITGTIVSKVQGYEFLKYALRGQ